MLLIHICFPVFGEAVKHLQCFEVMAWSQPDQGSNLQFVLTLSLSLNFRVREGCSNTDFPCATSLAWTAHISSFRICIFNTYVNWHLCHFYFNSARQELSIEEPLSMKLMEQLSSLLGDSRPGDYQCIEMSNCAYLLPSCQKNGMLRISSRTYTVFQWAMCTLHDM